MADKIERFGDFLVRIGALTAEQAGEVAKLQDDGNADLFGMVAIKMGFIEPGPLLEYVELKRREDQTLAEEEEPA